MKDRILFWIHGGLIHFGIAKYFADKYDSEIFSIIDCHYMTKKFFSDQTLVKFNKIWFFRDYISDKIKKPDLDYLKKIEDKYNLNLWHIAYSDRLFYQFNEYHKFTYEEILNILEQECKLFENILEEVKPNYLILESTDYHKHTLLCEMCKAKNIPILMLCPGRFGYRVTLSSDFDILDDFIEPEEDLKKSPRSQDQAKEYLEKYNTYQQFSKPFLETKKTGFYKVMLGNLRYLLFICNRKYRKFYSNWGKTRCQLLLLFRHTKKMF